MFRTKSCLQVVYEFEFQGKKHLQSESKNIYDLLSDEYGLSRQEVKLLSLLDVGVGNKTIDFCRRRMNMGLQETVQLLNKLVFNKVAELHQAFTGKEESVYNVDKYFKECLQRIDSERNYTERELHVSVMNYSDNSRKGLANAETGCMVLERIIKFNPNLQFSKGYEELGGRSLPLSERISLLIMAGVFINQGIIPIDSRNLHKADKTTFDEDDIEDDPLLYINKTADWQSSDKKPSIEEGIAGLLSRGYVVVVPDDMKEDKAGASDKKLYLLSHGVCRKLFRGMTHIINYDQMSRMAEAFRNEDIERKELFFDEDREGQFRQLKAVVQPERYTQFVGKLKKNGMSGGVTALFYGAPGTGKTELAKQLAKESGRDVFVADAARLFGSYWGESEKNMRELFRVFRYVNALSVQAPILLFNEADGLLSKRMEAVRAIEKAENAVLTIALQELETFEGIFIATTNRADHLDEAFDRRFLFKIEFRVPSPRTAAKIWLAKIPELSGEEALQLATRFPFSGGKIENVAKKRMLKQAVDDALLSFNDMMELCRNEELKGEGEQAYLRYFQIVRSGGIKACRLFYDDDIIPSIDTIREMVVSDRFEDIVDSLKKEGLSGAANILLHGAPGTGKTELAMQLARESGRDIYVVDVSKLYGSVMGEGEQNVRELFTKFRHQQVTADKAPILLFNEADGIIGKRLKVERVAEKEENAIQSLLLQELENFEGIFIATTNLIGNIDEAFDRRFLFKVEFHKPSPLTAAKIWRARIPELNYAEAFALAKEFSFSGGQIDNVAKRRIICRAVYQRTPTLEEMRRYCAEEQFRANQDTGGPAPVAGFSKLL